MALPRAVSNSIDKFAARLAFLTERLSRLERSTHRHEGGLSLQPVGSISDYIGLTPPTSAWVIMQGQTLVNAATVFPALFAIVPAYLKSGNSIVLPDTRGRVLVGYNPSDPDFNEVGETGGSKTVALTLGQLASHTHAAGAFAANLSGSLSMTGNTNFDGTHTHLVRDHPVGPIEAQGGSNIRRFRDNVLDGQATRGSSEHQHTVNLNGASHVHTLSGVSATSGSGEGHPNVQPYVVTVKILKVQ